MQDFSKTDVTPKTTAKNVNKSLHFPLLYLGLFLIANPTFNLLDILPNSLGTLCIVLALRNIPSSLLYFREARDALRRLFWISLSKLLAGFFGLTIMSGALHERGIFTVFGFLYFILELLFFIPAFRDLFRACEYLDTRYGIAACGGYATERGYLSTKSLMTFTYVFFVVRGLLSFFPESLFLYTYDQLSGESSMTYMVDRLYVPLLILCQIIGYVFMAFWLARVYRYFSGIRHNSDFTIFLSEETDRVGEARRKKERDHRLFRLAFLCLTIGIGLNIDLVFDNIGVFPDFVSALFLALFAVFLFRFLGKRLAILSAGLGAAYFASTLVTYLFETEFAVKYGPELLGRVIAADELYATCRTVAAVNAVVAAVVTVFLAYVLYRIAVLRLTMIPSDLSTYRGRRVTAVRAYYRNKCILFAVIGILDAAASVFQVFLRRYTDRVPAAEEIGSSVVLESFGWFWLVALAFSFLWLGYTIFLHSKIEAEWKDDFENA